MLRTVSASAPGHRTHFAPSPPVQQRGDAKNSYETEVCQVKNPVLKSDSCLPELVEKK